MNVDINELLKYKDNVDNDDVRFKEIIKDKLLNNDKIIYVLNNKELIEADAENAEYFGVNILPYYMVNPIQTNVQNFVCYEVQFQEVDRYNSLIKYGRVVFHILCERKNLIEEHTGIARHDLLAAILMEDFNWSNCFGVQIHCVEDKPTVVDGLFASRTLIFEGKFANSIAKTQNGSTRVVNNFGINR